MIDEFTIADALPHEETIVLEASAGTGKTWTIAALTTRYLAEGLATLPQMLVATFNRTAAHDLRTTIRARLVDAVASLEEVLATGSTSSSHPVDALYAREPDAAPLRLTRLRAALGDFDAATISTIHGFCDVAIDHLGILGDGTPQVTFADDLTTLAQDVASDLYLRAYSDRDRGEFSPRTALEIAEKAVASTAAIDEDHDRNGLRPEVRFAHAVRTEVQQRQRRLGLYTHDDRIGLLHDAVTDDEQGTLAVRRLRERYRVVLIDEFQDTDSKQWALLHRAFGVRTDGEPPVATLILIGDPKQSIYAFRGGEINAYLRATRTADRVRTLTTNHRSDAPLVEALSHLLQGAQLGSPDIRVHPVTARRQGSRLRIDDEDLDRPLRIRAVPTPGLKKDLESAIRDDVVADISRLLAVTHVSDDGSSPASRPLVTGDIAVLVQTNALAEKYCRALTTAGIPAVHSGATNVYASEAGDAWDALLAACERPQASAVRAVALTDFVGWSFADLVDADDAAINELSATVRRWSTLAATSIADLMVLLDSEGLATRLLGQLGGDRTLTDLRHIGQGLHAAQRSRNLGIAGLRAWLAEQRDTASETHRRLETDADAVQVFTVHRAKGLQFPVVYAPDLWWWSPFFGNKSTTVEYIDDDGPHLKVTSGPGRARMQRDIMGAGERLRLAYVAMTRAQSQLIVHWAANSYKTYGPLPRLLQQDGSTRPLTFEPVVPKDLPRLHHPGIGYAELGHVLTSAPPPRPQSDAPLAVREWTRRLDTGWRRSSYSSLTRDVHHGEPVADALLDDEEPTPLTDGPALQPDPTEEQISPLADLPRGPAFGTLVHAVLEDFDPDAADLRAELLAHCRHWAERLPSLGVTPQTLADALVPVVETPLGPIADDLRLRDIPTHDRLPELDFEMPLAGGYRARADRPGLRLGEVADILAEHLPADDPLIDYPTHLRAPELRDQELRGFLTGSIDAVVRLGSPARYLVVDYKTNWLLPPTDPGPLLLKHHDRDAMTRSMIDSHYPLQALLYSVALHRFLRWRLSDHDPARDLGGVAYLYVRGMGGPETPIIAGQRCGVFTWQPPASMIETLSERIDLEPAGLEETEPDRKERP